ncbi:MAG: N-acetyltransferase [Sphingobacteriales bacterium]|nr:MAG: N-acetyltransferase [Sphingobacteriales bacterium]
MITAGTILLVRLSVADGAAYYSLYKAFEAAGYFEEQVILAGEIPGDFARRMTSLCKDIWTIRLQEAPELIIGDCALHHHNPQNHCIEAGGSLLPDYRGKGYMKVAFAMMISFARQQYQVRTVVAKTTDSNTSAIRFAEGLGFCQCAVNGSEVVLRYDVE